MTREEQRCQRLMITRAYENGFKAGYDKGVEDGVDKASEIFASKLRNFTSSNEGQESPEGGERNGNDSN